MLTRFRLDYTTSTVELLGKALHIEDITKFFKALSKESVLTDIMLKKIEKEANQLNYLYEIHATLISGNHNDTQS